MESQFFLGIIAGVLIVSAAFLIPALMQMMRSARAVEEFLRTTQTSLIPLIMKLNEAAEKTTNIAAKLDESISNVQHLTKSVRETGEIIGDMNSFIRKMQAVTLITTSSFRTGVKAALSVLTQGLIKKGG